jgi:hypothetical protein
MSGFFRFLAFLLAIGLLAAVGIGIYNAGVSAGMGTEAGAPPYVGQPWGWGWVGSIFAFIFGLFFLFLFVGLIFGLFRAAFGWGHGGRHHGWNGHGGYGRTPYSGERSYFEEWHRELHGEPPTGPDTEPGTGPGSSPQKPAPDQA